MKAHLLTFRYTYRRASWEQDLILEQEIAGSPQDWGLDPANTLVELYSESFGPDTPRRVRQVLADGGPADGMTDERLEFAGASISEGVAYVMGRQAESVPVCKTWVEADGRRFIVESLPWLRLRGLIERAGLAKQGGGSEESLAGCLTARNREELVRLAAANREDRDRLRWVAGFRPQGSMPRSGVVWDYRLDLPGGGPPGGVFRSDHTYSIVGDTTISTGTATFEAGTCIKSTAGKKLTISVPVTWNGSLSRPVLFGAKDDDSFGELVPGSTHTPSGYYGNPALEIRIGGTQLKHLRVTHAQVGVFFYDFSAGNANSVDHGYGFVISWATNASIVVEACEDLALPEWSPVGTNTLVDGWSHFSDPEWTNFASRFYRIRSP